MPALLFGIGVFALFAGLVMIGFGVPINEFSFGNTLIGAGTTAAVGGLIIIGLGAVAGSCGGWPRCSPSSRWAGPRHPWTLSRPPPRSVQFPPRLGPAPVRAATPVRPKADLHADDVAPRRARHVV